jgi:formylglycine-generating enzyme required for sulfatase activity
MFEFGIDTIFNTDHLLNISLGFGVVMTLLAIKDHYTFKSSGKSHENYKSSIISLGIFGTFFGIIAGLWNFDTANIENSVPALLDGLKTAFLTSFFGMGLTTLLGIIQEKGSSSKEKSDGELLLQSVYQTNLNLETHIEETSKNFNYLFELILQSNRNSREIADQIEFLQEALLKSNSNLDSYLEKIQTSIDDFNKIREEERVKKEKESEPELERAEKESLEEVKIDEKPVEKIEEDENLRDIGFQENFEDKSKTLTSSQAIEKKRVSLPAKLDEVQMRDYIKPAMVKISRGSFMMGSEDGRDFEKPLHKVSIDYSFYVGKYPVTFDEYDKFCEDTGKKKPKDKGWGRGRQPVINISWNEAKEYAEWISEKSGEDYTLLSESEWEYIARAGTSTKWSFGDSSEQLEDYAWFDINSGDRTHSVGEKRPNGWNIYDVHGNVWEWCEDDWVQNYEETPIDGTPNSIENSNRKVIRGGAYFNFQDYTRSVNRSSSEKSKREPYFGFRLKMNPKY